MSARVVLVSGGGRGIGRAIALRLAKDGLGVAVGARSAEAVEETVAAVRAAGSPALALTLDVTEPPSITAAVDRVARELGPVDVLVNNAGIAETAPFLKTELARWERHLRVNATGPFLLTQAVLGGMLERRWGRIVNVASLAGLHGSPYVVAYTASKHALVGLTRALATEVAGKGVTVNAICPGFVATDMVWRGARNIVDKTGKSFEEAVQALANMNPGRRLIEPEEVAEVAARLVSDATTSGECVVLDGSEPSPKGARS